MALRRMLARGAWVMIPGVRRGLPVAAAAAAAAAAHPLLWCCRRRLSTAPHEEPPQLYKDYHGTTVLCVRKDNDVVVVGDGQVTFGSTVLKADARKVRRLGQDVVGGFAGTTADAITLFEHLENKLQEHPGQLKRACVELAKMWRTDKFLRRLEAIMVVADAKISLMLTGNGDVVETSDGLIGIGSGGNYALAAARALIDLPEMSAETIAVKAMKIAADICIYTNGRCIVEHLKDGVFVD